MHDRDAHAAHRRRPGDVPGRNVTVGPGPDYIVTHCVKQEYVRAGRRRGVHAGRRGPPRLRRHRLRLRRDRHAGALLRPRAASRRRRRQRHLREAGRAEQRRADAGRDLHRAGSHRSELRQGDLRRSNHHRASGRRPGVVSGRNVRQSDLHPHLRDEPGGAVSDRDAGRELHAGNRRELHHDHLHVPAREQLRRDAGGSVHRRHDDRRRDAGPDHLLEDRQRRGLRGDRIVHARGADRDRSGGHLHDDSDISVRRSGPARPAASIPGLTSTRRPHAIRRSRCRWPTTRASAPQDRPRLRARSSTATCGRSTFWSPIRGALPGPTPARVS